MRTQLTILFLILAGTIYGQVGMPVNNYPCTPIVLNPTGDSSIMYMGSNVGATADTTYISPSPVCLTNTNTVYYLYQVPARYSNFEAKLTPMDSQNMNMIFMRPSACSTVVGAYMFPSLSCTDNDDGDGILVSNMGSNCLNPDSISWVLIRIAGQEGPFKLEVDLIKPNCSDGCRNGNEIAIDSVPDIPIAAMAADDRICTGDSLKLQVPTLLDDYTWSTGDTGTSITVTDIGWYGVVATDEFGCVFTGTKLVRADPDCVWPGETNLDGRVNARDILPIGQAFGFTGPPRTSVVATIDFVGQPATTWGASLVGFYAGVDIKNADCNGDGVVDELDAIAVQQNYGGEIFLRQSGERPGDPLIDPHIFIEFEEDMLEAGDTLRALIHLGDSAMPVDTIYQFAFHLNFPSYLVDTNTLNISFDTSWVGDDSGQNLGFYKYLPQYDFVDISYTRTDQLNVGGYGPIMEMDIVIIDDLGGKLVADEIMNFSFSQDIFLTLAGDSVDIYPEEDSVIISQYCLSKGIDSDSSYIFGVGFNQYKLPTYDNDGYFDTLITSGFLRQGQTYIFRAAPGYPGFPIGGGPPIDMEWKIWADFNHDGFLKVSDGELLIHTITDTYVGVPVTIPVSTQLGHTIFRYQMKVADGIPPEPCEDILYGEVEDWTIEIKQAASRSAEDLTLTGNRLTVYPNPAGKIEMATVQFASRDTIEFATVQLTSLTGAMLYEQDLSEIDNQVVEIGIPIAQLPNGFYLVSLRSTAGIYTTKLLIER